VQRNLTHIDEHGRATMVDVGAKPVVRRDAIAEGLFVASPATLDLVMSGRTPKGEALAVARVAGVLAAKQCDRLIPLCHTLPLDSISVEFERAAPDRIRVVATACVTARTGVELEALAAVSIAALTLYDMTKGVDRDLRIDGIRLVSKTKSPE
jgi:cyclic pyranopterin phosphate synthase